MFIPTTRAEAAELGWERFDVILVCGDTYIDSSYFGVALIGKLLIAEGYRVGIIAQPQLDSGIDIARLGEPELFWGVSAGCVDSMVSNYTALLKPRRQDDLTPGGDNCRRPDRACIAYTNLIRRFFKHTVPIVLGGIEASLRRLAHYDYWSDSVRRSVLLDAKADFLLYGMAERAILELAACRRSGGDPGAIRGLCQVAASGRDGYVELPDYDQVASDRAAFARLFKLMARHADPQTAKGMQQRHGDRYLLHHPPALPLTPAELDRVYNLPFERAVHPYYAGQGEVRALETIRFSITSHRGCCGECSFCAISLHQGRAIVSRSEGSILREAAEIAATPGFKGIIYDVGGPTANMYGLDCHRPAESGRCPARRCLFPGVCGKLDSHHARQINLLRQLRAVPGVKRVFVASGVRVDLILADQRHGRAYLEELVRHHLSGQMKVAPEHCEADLLALMGKPSIKTLRRFRERFAEINRQAGKELFLTYYFLAAHPGCTDDHMRALARFARLELRHRPEQVQIFTPTPSTLSTLIYHTGKHPETGEELFVERTLAGKERQKRLLQNPPPATLGHLPDKKFPPRRPAPRHLPR